jgi:hypothetical protein
VTALVLYFIPCKRKGGGSSKLNSLITLNTNLVSAGFSLRRYCALGSLAATTCQRNYLEWAREKGDFVREFSDFNLQGQVVGVRSFREGVDCRPRINDEEGKVITQN